MGSVQSRAVRHTKCKELKCNPSCQTERVYIGLRKLQTVKGFNCQILNSQSVRRLMVSINVCGLWRFMCSKFSYPVQALVEVGSDWQAGSSAQWHAVAGYGGAGCGGVGAVSLEATTFMLYVSKVGSWKSGEGLGAYSRRGGDAAEGRGRGAPLASAWLALSTLRTWCVGGCPSVCCFSSPCPPCDPPCDPAFSFQQGGAGPGLGWHAQPPRRTPRSLAVSLSVGGSF